MSLKERVYSVLVVSAAEKFNTGLSSLLPHGAYNPVQFVSSVSAAKRAVLDRAYDFVIINAPLPDDMGLHFAIDTGSSGETVVLLMVREAMYDEITDRMTEHGVFTMSKPTSGQVISLALRWMASARERLRKTEKKTLSMQEKMEEIRIVNRAKWLLIDRRGMDEAQAHRWIEKQAMDRCITKRAVAEEIIRTES